MTLRIKSVLQQSWQANHHQKRMLWTLIGPLLLITAVLQVMVYGVFHVDLTQTPYLVRYITFPILTDMTTAPFYAGLLLVGIRHIRGDKLTIYDGYQHFHRWISLAFALIVLSFACQMPIRIIELPEFRHLPLMSLVLLHTQAILWFLIFSGFVCLAIPLMVDKKLSFLRALCRSMRLTSEYGVTVITLLALGWVLIIVPFIPFIFGVYWHITWLAFIGFLIGGISCIWTLPWIVLIFATIYCKLVDGHQ